jgi:uroporphyrinogen-III synthase
VSSMVQVALTRDQTEAEEIQSILQSAGIESELEAAVEHHPAALDDAPTKVLVAETSLEAAQHAIEAMTDPDELIGGR